MPYVAAEAIEAARQIDLLSYLRTHEPNELVHVSGNTYCTREHDSLKISNGKWHWFSRGIGGRNALDYLVKVKEMSFPDAVSLLTGTPPQSYTAPKEPVIPKERRLLLPDVDTNCDTVKQYLDGRGIHATVVDYCIEKKILFQTAQYKNALFVGYDQMGKPRYGALRSTFSRYKAEAAGSDKHYSFSIAENLEAHRHSGCSSVRCAGLLQLPRHERRAVSPGVVSLRDSGTGTPTGTANQPVLRGAERCHRSS